MKLDVTWIAPNLSIKNYPLYTIEYKKGLWEITAISSSNNKKDMIVGYKKTEAINA